LTPTELAEQTMVTSGAISKRVDRCEEQGWVTRNVEDHDRRARRVRLTETGRALIDDAFNSHIANEHRLVGPLSADDRKLLEMLLRRWGSELGVS
jgi:DNA-binding MarR family transcriptional regulator